MNQRIQAILGLLVLSLSFPTLTLRALDVAEEPASPAALPSESPHHATYTVVHGDSFTSVSEKFHCTIRQLKKLNGLTGITHLKAGLVLQIPSSTKKGRTFPPIAKSNDPTFIPFHTPRAVPVTDLDLPASTFASCPVPVPTDSDTPETSAVLPLAASPSPALVLSVKPASSPLPSATSWHAVPQALPLGTPEFSCSAPPSTPPPAPKPAGHGIFSFLFSSPPPANDWGTRFAQTARELGNRGIEYNESWCPPGESHSWAMDCSNTARYLYRTTAGIELPRTASDQYYYLHLQNKAWDVPQTSTGFADCNYLRQNLKPGDLLFWENTYRPERQPPITHVMVFLGTNDRGNWIMAGSQTGRGGEHNRRRGGPDVYVFDPTKPCGGYTTWLGLVHHQGRFCAFGRPLEADQSKLSVASND
jgi:LysM repeat protein